MESSQNPRPFVCPYEGCSKNYKYRRDLINHCYVHTGERLHKCPHCQKSYTRKYRLNRHINSHLGIKIYQCDKCERKFSRKDVLKEHLERDHRNSDEPKDLKPYLCLGCGKSYVLERYLKRHLRMLGGDKVHEFLYDDL